MWKLLIKQGAHQSVRPYYLVFFSGMEVAENGDLANWMIPDKVFKGLEWSDGSCQRSETRYRNMWVSIAKIHIEQMKEAVGDGVELIRYRDISFCLFNSLRCFYHHCSSGTRSFLQRSIVISSGKQTWPNNKVMNMYIKLSTLLFKRCYEAIHHQFIANTFIQ